MCALTLYRLQMSFQRCFNSNNILLKVLDIQHGEQSSGLCSKEIVGLTIVNP